MSNQKTTYGGLSFGGALFLLFLGLKITGYITWSWWWIFAPLWIPFIIFIVFLIFIAIVKTLL